MSAAGQHLVDAPFDAHVELLELFLTRRDELVERVQELLNAQRKPVQYLQDVALLSRHFEDCFSTLAGLTREQAELRRQLEEAHLASGFKPRRTPGQPNDLVDPAQLMTRAFLLWQRTRWPGHAGRVGYAHTLFNVYLLRRLMLLCLRLWDAEPARAGERLAQLQRLLDELVATTPADQPVLVRDARSLFPLAQSPTTDELHGYFDVAERITATLARDDRIEIHKASVRMAGGHLRSQLRHVCTQKGVSLDEPNLVSSTRKSNALDVATLMQNLVPLLEAYERAADDGDSATRLELADAICQGISPDPELFVNRLDLLRPYSMIEHLFIATDADDHAAYTPMGERHLRLLDEYTTRIGRAAQRLHDDCAQFRPMPGGYSPYGLLFGFSSQLLEHMALKAAQPGTAPRYSIEDAFVAGGADKLDWVSGWRKLPHVPRDVAKLFDYPQPFAEECFARVERAWHGRVEQRAVAATGRLFVLPAQRHGESGPALAPALPAQYCVASDRQLAAERKVEAVDEAQLLNSRLEGELLVSYPTSGGWMALSKDVLTDVLGAGRDAEIAWLPRQAAEVLELMSPELVVARNRRMSG